MNEMKDFDKGREAYGAHVLRQILSERKRLRDKGEQCADTLVPMPYDDFIKEYMQGCVTRQIAQVDASGNVTWREGWPAFITRYEEVTLHGGVCLRFQLSYAGLEESNTESLH